MSSIETTVRETLTARGYGSYMSHAAPVVEALVEREQGIAEALVEFATSKGLSSSEAWGAIEEAGLSVPAPAVAPAAEGTTDERIVESLHHITEVLAGLTAFARQHGYRG